MTTAEQDHPFANTPAEKFLDTSMHFFMNTYGSTVGKDTPISRIILRTPLYELLPLYLTIPEQTKEVLYKYPNLNQLASEFTKDELWHFLASPRSLEARQASLGFSLALVIDYLESNPDKNQDFLPANASQEDNLAYLRKNSPLVDESDHFHGFPIKPQFYRALAEADLADPDTKCFPLWDVFSIATNIAKLIKDNRIAWISTAKVDDVAYSGIPRTNADKPYTPEFPQLITGFHHLVEVLKQRKPELFPKALINHTSPLFQGIGSHRQFFMEVIPQLVELSIRDPYAFCKVFPQDKELSIATAIIDTTGRESVLGDLGPNVTFEMSTNEHTPRGPVKIDRRVIYYPQYNLIIGDKESARVFYEIFSSQLENGQGFLAGLDSLFANMSMSSAAVEFMVKKEGEQHQVAFCTDAIPIRKNSTRPDSVSSLFDRQVKTEATERRVDAALLILKDAVVVNPAIDKERIKTTLAVQQLLLDLQQDLLESSSLSDMEQALLKGLRQQLLTSPNLSKKEALEFITRLKNELLAGKSLPEFEQEFLTNMEARLRDSGTILEDEHRVIARLRSYVHESDLVRAAESGEPVSYDYLPEACDIPTAFPSVPLRKRPSYPQDIARANQRLKERLQELLKPFPKLGDLIS